MRLADTNVRFWKRTFRQSHGGNRANEAALMDTGVLTLAEHSGHRIIVRVVLANGHACNSADSATGESGRGYVYSQAGGETGQISPSPAERNRGSR